MNDSMLKTLSAAGCWLAGVALLLWALQSNALTKRLQVGQQKPPEIETPASLNRQLLQEPPRLALSELNLGGALQRANQSAGEATNGTGGFITLRDLPGAAVSLSPSTAIRVTQTDSQVTHSNIVSGSNTIKISDLGISLGRRLAAWRLQAGGYRKL